MIVLKEFKLLLKIIGLNSRGGLENIIVRLIYLFLLFTSGFMFTMFFILNIRENSYRALAALSAIFGFTILTSNYLHLLIDRDHFHSLLDRLQNIVDERMKRRENKVIYRIAEQQISSAAKLTMHVLLSIPVLSLSPFILAAYHWCLGKYTLDSWIFFYPVWTPFDLNTTFLCVLMVLHQASNNTCCTFLFSSMPILLIGFLIYSKACFLDIKLLLGHVGRLSKPDKFQSPESEGSSLPSRENVELNMLELCKEAVQLYQEVTGLLHCLTDAMNAIFLEVILLWTMCICGSLLIIEKYSGTNFFYDMQMPIMTTVFPLIVLATLSYLSQNYYSNVVELCATIYQTEWYLYPRSAQRFVLLMIMRSQRPFYLNAYGMMSLNLENFVRLLNRIYSALMVLRRMD